MKRRSAFVCALVFSGIAMCDGQQGRATAGPVEARSQGPCDIYAAGQTPCIAAHSTTRALYAAYNGPLYQVKRTADGKTLDVGVVRGGGYANVEAQDAFCANAMCVISLIYDQSGRGIICTRLLRERLRGRLWGRLIRSRLRTWLRLRLAGIRRMACL